MWNTEKKFTEKEVEHILEAALLAVAVCTVEATGVNLIYLGVLVELLKDRERFN